jgi:hypothetical protein
MARFQSNRHVSDAQSKGEKVLMVDEKKLDDGSEF